MKICPQCGTQLEDNVMFCPVCGATQAAAQAAPQPADQGAYQQPADQGAPAYNYAPQNYAAPVYAPMPAADDHTAEFDPQDIADNKLYASLVYLTSVIGIIIAALVAKDSPFVKFHIKQSVKLFITQMLLALAVAILAFTIIVPIVGGIAVCVLAVIQIICFFQTLSGKAKEPAIIKSLKFLQ